LPPLEDSLCYIRRIHKGRLIKQRKRYQRAFSIGPRVAAFVFIASVNWSITSFNEHSPLIFACMESKEHNKYNKELRD
jgi:hypothetical protein